MSSGPSRPPGDAPVLRLAAFLPYRLNVASTLVSEGLARTYEREFGLGVPEWRVLATVAEFESTTAKAVGLHAHMGKVKVSRAVAALEKRGLIARRANTDDLREAILVLTPDGSAMYDAIVPLALDYARHLTSDLSDVDRKTLERLLDLLVRGAGKAGSALRET